MFRQGVPEGGPQVLSLVRVGGGGGQDCRIDSCADQQTKTNTVCIAMSKVIGGKNE